MCTDWLIAMAKLSNMASDRCQEERIMLLYNIKAAILRGKLLGSVFPNDSAGFVTRG